MSCGKLSEYLHVVAYSLIHAVAIVRRVCFCRSISEMTRRLLMDYNKEEPPLLGTTHHLQRDNSNNTNK